MPSVQLGRDIQTGEVVEIGDIERRSGLYILGKPGMGKSVLMVNMAIEDLYHGHKIFFLDPHGDAISDFMKRFYYNGEGDFFSYLYDPADREYAFGINLLSCPDTTDLTAITDTYTRAYNVFYKLWEDSWGPWLQLILQNTLWAFIENQEYTLAEVPLFLNPRNTAFRNYILSNVKLNPACRDFWEYEFFERKERSQQERVDAALTRIHTLLTHPYVRHIIGQKETTIDFRSILSDPDERVVLFKLSANLPEDIKRFIGTILFSEILHAVRNRPEDKRDQFSIFVDEFQNFTSSDDIRTLITDGRKFGSAITYAHQERFGQFADNQRLMGATLAAANKVFFQSTVKDSAEIAPEFAKEATTTETRLEPVLVISQNPFWDLLNHGHTNAKILSLFNKYLRRMNDWLDEKRMELEAQGLDSRILQAETNLLRDQIQLTQTNERRERLVSQYASDRMSSNYGAIANTEVAIEKLIATHKLSEQEAFSLKLRFSEFSQMRLRVRNINRFLSEIMQQDTLLLAAQEQHAQFFIDILVEFIKSHNPIQSSYPETFESLLKLYLQLEFGDPTIARSIPAYLGMKYWPQELEKAYMDMRRWRYIRYYGEREIKEKLPKGYFTKDLESNLSQDLYNYRNNEKTTNYWGKPIVKGMTYYSFSYRSPLRDEQLPLRDEELPDLLPRILTSSEIKTIKDMCYNELISEDRSIWKIPPFPQAIKELEEFSQLLSKPENHIKVPSGQYVEKQVHVRPVHDMTDEMAQELTNLPRFTAYAKIIEEKDGEQKVKTTKIQTYRLPKILEGADDDMRLAINNGHFNSKERSEIEEEIRERQEKWRVVAAQTASEPPQTSQPPPTSD